MEVREKDNKQTPARRCAVWEKPRQKSQEKTHESIKGDQSSSLLHPPFRKKRQTLVISLQMTWRSRLVHCQLVSNAQGHPFWMLQETAFACSVLTEISKLCNQKLIQSRFRQRPLRLRARGNVLREQRPRPRRRLRCPRPRPRTRLSSR